MVASTSRILLCELRMFFLYCYKSLFCLLDSLLSMLLIHWCVNLREASLFISLPSSPLLLSIDALMHTIVIIFSFLHWTIIQFLVDTRYHENFMVSMLISLQNISLSMSSLPLASDEILLEYYM